MTRGRASRCSPGDRRRGQPNWLAIDAGFCVAALGDGEAPCRWACAKNVAMAFDRKIDVFILAFDIARMIRRNNSTGFCMGCLPCIFSPGFGVATDQTERICKSAFFNMSPGHSPFFHGLVEKMLGLFTLARPYQRLV
jgi:hypothetical protein